MSLNVNKIRIVAIVKNGLIEGFYTNSFDLLEVVVADYDMADGASSDELVQLSNGHKFVGNIDSASNDVSFVNEVFATLNQETLTIDSQNDAYVSNSGNLCPNCGSKHIEASGKLEADSGIAWGNVSCKNCNSTWTDQFRLMGYSDLNATPIKLIRSNSERGYYALNQGWVFDVASATRFSESATNLNDWTFKPISSGDDAELVLLEHCFDFTSGDL